MDYLLLTNIVLAIFTGIYVVLTWKLTSESKRANKINLDAMNKQISLATLPYMYCDIKLKEGDLILTIYNTGNVPAYGVSLVCLGTFDIEDSDNEKFRKTYFKEKNMNNEFEIDENGFCMLFDNYEYSHFANGKKVVNKLRFPIKPMGIDILIQYRGINGDNYLQLYIFSQDTYDEDLYRLGIIYPTTLQPVGRFEYMQYKYRNTVHKGKKIDIDIDECFKGINKNDYMEFVNSLDIATHCNYLINNVPGVEDRGEWMAI